MGPLTYLHSSLLKIRIVWICPYCIGDLLLRNICHSTTNRGWNLIFFTELSLLELLGILENSVTEYSFPGIKKSWKILSWKKIVLEFSQNNLTKKNIFPGIYSSGIFHSWNFPFLEFCPGTFCSWNLISRNFLATGQNAQNCELYQMRETSPTIQFRSKLF